MRSEDRILRDLRRSRFHAWIIGLAILLLCIPLGLHLRTLGEFRDSMTSEYIDSLVKFQQAEPALAVVLAELHRTSNAVSNLTVRTMFFMCMIAVLVAALSVELSGRHPHRLTASLWERVHRLEEELARGQGVSSPPEPPVREADS